MIAANRGSRMILSGAAALGAVLAGLTLHATPAEAWWRGGVWVAGPGPAYWGPPPMVYPPPVVVAPPPVYYAPPPVVYAPPTIVYPAPVPAPPAPYFPPQPAAPAQSPAAARSCVTQTLSCAMTVSRAPGSGCYCTDQSGDRMYGTVQ